jgi:hypothetical protein
LTKREIKVTIGSANYLNMQWLFTKPHIPVKNKRSINLYKPRYTQYCTTES